MSTLDRPVLPQFCIRVNQLFFLADYDNYRQRLSMDAAHRLPLTEGEAELLKQYLEQDPDNVEIEILDFEEVS